MRNHWNNKLKAGIGWGAPVLLLCLGAAIGGCLDEPAPWVPDVCHLEPCADVKGDNEEQCWICPAGTERCFEPGCACEPLCDGRQCGPDGCGGECGECAGTNDWCDEEGQCICRPDCDTAECGDDGCGGSCGTCEGTQDKCIQGVCICQLDCEGRECGADGCGGLCGSCGAGESCVDGLCGDNSECGAQSECQYNMVHIPDTDWCMDSFESSNEDYAEFLVAKNKLTNKCSHDVYGEGPCIDEEANQGRIRHSSGTWISEHPDRLLPVVGVTWVGAFEACAAQCKVLCPQDIREKACTRGYTLDYPYEDDYGGFNEKVCNGADAETPPELWVPGGPGYCEGGYDDLFDLTGNAWEWIDSCKDGACLSAGGGFQSPSWNLDCMATKYAPPFEGMADRGLRCCHKLD